jgi:hypothetical protein
MGLRVLEYYCAFHWEISMQRGIGMESKTLEYRSQIECLLEVHIDELKMVNDYGS